MKKISVFIITLYQKIFSPLLLSLVGVKKACRFEVSCSEYTKQMILEKGFYKGTLLGIKRLLSCHPFATIRQ